MRRVYKDFRQFDQEDDLREAIITARETIELQRLQNLIAFMPDRCMKVIVKRGGQTRYKTVQFSTATAERVFAVLNCFARKNGLKEVKS